MHNTVVPSCTVQRHGQRRVSSQAAGALTLGRRVGARTLSSGAGLGMTATEISGTTVYWLKVLVPMKW